MTKIKKMQDNIRVGIVDMTTSGNAFIIVEALPKDVLVLKSDLNGALHKDTVEIAIKTQKKNRLYGKVTKIKKRYYTELTGFYKKENHIYKFYPLPKYKIIGGLQLVIPPDLIIEENDKVIAIIEKENKNKFPTLKAIKILDPENSEQETLNDILTQNEFNLHFPKEVLEYSQKCSFDIETELNHRLDFRKILTFTIDPFDAKDFDDALSYQLLSNGNLQIGIHIADVSHFVLEQSPLDKEAFDRATSVYLPGFVLPMLPEKISNHLCSLVPNEDRLCFSVIIEISTNKDKINIVNTQFAKTIIHSQYRFTYEEIQDVLENKKNVSIQAEILQLHQIANNLRQERIKKNAINFSSAEIRFELNEKKEPINVFFKESKESHQLVEEFMLLANRSVAEYLGKHQITIPYRVHDVPDEKKIINFANFVRKFGFAFKVSSSQLISQQINQLLENCQGKKIKNVFEKLAIRSMAKALYTTQNIGHYGLGFEYYTHFTSPIRRYPDLLTHRILNNFLTKVKHKKTKEFIEQQCEHCNLKEKSAVEAERTAIKYKQVQYMSSFIGQEFEAMITGVANFGIWAETLTHHCEGFIRMADLLTIDDFYFNAEEYCLVGKKSKQRLSIGDSIQVLIVAAKIEEKELDYEFIKKNKT